MLTWEPVVRTLPGTFPNRSAANLAIRDITLALIAEEIGADPPATTGVGARVDMPDNDHNSASFRILGAGPGVGGVGVYHSPSGMVGGIALGREGDATLYSSMSYTPTLVTCTFHKLANAHPDILCYKSTGDGYGQDGANNFPFILYKNQAMIGGGVNGLLLDLRTGETLSESIPAVGRVGYTYLTKFTRKGYDYPELWCSSRVREQYGHSDILGTTSLLGGIVGWGAIGDIMYYSSGGTLIQLSK